MDSRVPAPAAARWPPPFRREETEAFVSHVRSRQSEASGDRMLEWCSSPEYRSQNIRFRKTRTLSKKAIDAYIPEGIQRADFTEPLDGNQRLIFFFRCLYDAIKELLRNTRFAGRQYTHAEIKFNSTGGRVYSAFNTGEVYELAQLHAGDGVSPVPIFISSDGTMVSKKMGGHPIFRECLFLSLSLDIGLY